MANSYIVTCCSTADLPEQYLAEREIPYACFHYRMGENEYDDDLGKSVAIGDFYQKIRDGAMPTTSQVNPEQYIAMFQPILESGKDIIHLTLSTGISGTYNSAIIARDEMAERYPGRRIRVIDSLQASAGYGLLIDTAWEKMNAGAGYEELAAWIEDYKLNLHGWFFTMDLTHLKRGGRISVPAAFFGSMLNICPLMNVDFEGKLIPRDKCRGKKKVMKELVERMKTHAQGGTGYLGKCFISHSSCLEDARSMAALIEETFPYMNSAPWILDIGTVIGSHTGPGTVAVFFWGDPRTN